MRHSLTFSVFCLALVFPALVFGAKLRVDYDPAYDFSELRDYQWRTHPEMEKDPYSSARGPLMLFIWTNAAFPTRLP